MISKPDQNNQAAVPVKPVGTDEPVFFQILYALAALGRNPRTAVAALIVDRNRQIVAYGVNDLPRGVSFDRNRFLDPTDKHDYVEHAERNAIFAAARAGRGTEGATIYTHMVPCPACARAIVQSGIVTVKWHGKFPNGAHKRQDSISRIILNEAGIELLERQEPVPHLVSPPADGEPSDVFDRQS